MLTFKIFIGREGRTYCIRPFEKSDVFYSDADDCLEWISNFRFLKTWIFVFWEVSKIIQRYTFHFDNVNHHCDLRGIKFLTLNHNK